MNNEKQPDSASRREVIHSYLEFERVEWLDAKAWAERSGHASVLANNAESEAMERIDSLLDELGRIGITGTM